LTTFELLPQVVRRCTVPVVAAGGIMDGCDIQKAIDFGASAVQMGTAFLQRLGELVSAALTPALSALWAKSEDLAAVPVQAPQSHAERPKAQNDATVQAGPDQSEVEAG
ncbi:MAG: hypothetical protein EBW74_06640, partial [Betaproteobacteria bacterium]|nr:hypothetical protein [Betaproteobacteria bacterium]